MKQGFRYPGASAVELPPQAQAGLRGAAVGAESAAIEPRAADLHSAQPVVLIIILGIW